jgi:hypothetical protein
VSFQFLVVLGKFLTAIIAVDNENFVVVFVTGWTT